MQYPVQNFMQKNKSFLLKKKEKRTVCLKLLYPNPSLIDYFTLYVLLTSLHFCLLYSLIFLFSFHFVLFCCLFYTNIQIQKSKIK